MCFLEKKNPFSPIFYENVVNFTHFEQGKKTREIAFYPGVSQCGADFILLFGMDLIVPTNLG